MDYEQRKEAAKASIARLGEVVTLGITKHGWIVHKASGSTNANEYSVVIIDNGRHFILHTGLYSEENRINASVSPRNDEDSWLIVTQADIKPKFQAATFSASRPADKLLADIRRRVTDNEEARHVAHVIEETLSGRVSMRASLLKHIETLRAAGCRFQDLSPSTYWSAQGWHRNASRLTVTSHGNVSFEASASVTNFATILPILN